MSNPDKKIKLSIDLMGGDNSPKKTLEGIDLFVKRYSNEDDYFFYLYLSFSVFNIVFRLGGNPLRW